jgi:hypothetical protein
MPIKDPLKQIITPRVRNLLAIFSLLLLPLGFFWRETLGHRTLGDQDAVFWFFPAYKFVSEQIKSGSLPLWNPYQYSGAPMFAEWQAGALDPINWIYLIETTSRALTLSLELGFAVALLAAFSYARSVGFNHAAALFSAVIYGLSGFAVARTLYPGFLHIVALTPFVLYFVERLYRDGRWRYVAGGALIIAWQVFAAHPQPLIYSSLLACAYALFCAFFRRDEAEFQISNLRSQIRFLARFAVMFIAGAGLSAVQLLPAAESAHQSVRREWPFELFTLHSLHPLSLVTTLFPFFHGAGQEIYRMPFWGVYWHHNEAQIYLGVTALSLAIAGAIFAWRVRFGVGIFWGGVAFIGMILAFGKYSGPTARALYHVPVIGNFRSPNRHWMEVTLAVAFLAGYAVDRLLREDSRFLARSAQIAAGALTALCLAIGGFVLWRRDLAESFIRSLPDFGQTPQGFLQTAGAEFYLPMVTAACALLAIVIFARARRRYRWFAPLLALLIVDYYLYATYAPITNPDKLETLIGTAMPKSLAAEQHNRAPFRYHVILTPALGEFNPLWFYGNEMVTGYDPVLNERYKTFSGVDEAGRSFISTLLDPEDQTLDLLNARYVFAPQALFDPNAAKENGRQSEVHAPGDRSRWREITVRSDVAPYRDYRVFENLRTLPRAWLVGRVKVAYDGDQLKLIRGAMTGQSFDPRAEALVAPIAEPKNRWYSGFLPESDANSTAPTTQMGNSAQASQAGSVTIQDRKPGRIQVEATAPTPSILVLSEIAYPGWRARVDGKDQEWKRVDYMLLGVPFSAGTHSVELVYRPSSINLGAVVSLTTALCLILGVLWGERKTR